MGLRNKKGDMVFEGLLVIIFIFTVIFMFIDIASTGKEKRTEYFQNRDYKIYSIERDKKITGDFILGSGMVSSKPVYYAYIDKESKENEKGYVLKEIPGNAIIIEFNKNSLTTPHVEEKIYNCKEYIGIGKSCDKEVKIFVPENSVIKKINKPNVE